MSWLTEFFFKKKEEQNSAQSVKDRLQVVLIHDRQNLEGPDFLPQLKLDIINSIKKYIPISDDQVKVNVSSRDETSMMEVSVSLDPKFDESDTGAHKRYSTEEDLDKVKPYKKED